MRGKTNGVFNRATVRDRSFEIAITIKIVFHELALAKAAFHELAIWKSRPSGDAVHKLALDENANIEEAPIPVDTREGTAAKIGIDVTSLNGKVFEAAEFQKTTVEINQQKILRGYCLRFYHAK